jgi:hypothetical protein
MRRSDRRRATSLTRVPEVTVSTFEVMMSFAFMEVSLVAPSCTPARIE